MEKYQISTELHNFCRTFDADLTKPQMNRLKELIHGIIRGKKGILSEIARQNGGKQKKNIRKQVQQYSNMLLKFPLKNMVIRKMIGVKSEIKKDTPLYFDLVDITKEYFKSMEMIGTTWNGSEGVPGRGYEMVDVSLGTPKSDMTLHRHLYSTEHLDYDSQVKEIEKVLKVMISAWGEMRGTSFVDSGGDNNLLIELFLKYQAAFAIRMNVNRGKQDRIVLDERGDEIKMMQLWGGNIQGVTGWHDAKEKKQKIVQIKWCKIFWRFKKELIPLWMVWTHREDDPDPCVFLTSRKIENSLEAEKIYRQYFARGGKQEAIFKCSKSKLGMEKVQLCSFEKVKQLMLIYVLVDQFLVKLHEQALEAGHLLHTYLMAFIQGAQRKITKWAIIDFYDDTCSKLERDFFIFRNRFWPSPPASQLSLFLNSSEKW
jgi:hypothetical protein